MEQLKTYLNVVTWLMLTLLPFSVQAQPASDLKARLGISPPRVEIALDESGLANGEFTVLNLSGLDLPVALSVVHWDLDDASQVRVIPPTEQSLDQWLVINPLQFVVPPNGSQTVRFGVRPRVRAEPGEHRAMIYVSEQQAANAGEGFKVRLNFGLPIYANMGEIQRSPIIHDMSLEARPEVLAVTLDIENVGNAYIRPRGHVGVWSRRDYPGDVRAAEWLEADGATRAELYTAPALFTGRLSSQPILGGNRRQQLSLVPRAEVPDVEEQVALVSLEIEGQRILETFSISN